MQNFANIKKAVKKWLNKFAKITKKIFEKQLEIDTGNYLTRKIF